MGNRSEVWREIWQKKYEVDDFPDTTDLIHSRDGFDTLSNIQYEKLTGYFLEKLSVTDHDDIVEIGCGAGAFLEHISSFRFLSGVDCDTPDKKEVRRHLRSRRGKLSAFQ
jgi:cyclopropane fatty-acyl-phospholipid synthase-like methyltransferase